MVTGCFRLWMPESQWLFQVGVCMHIERVYRVSVAFEYQLIS